MNPELVPASFDLALLNSFIEVLPDACVLLDLNGFIIAVNQAWKDLPRMEQGARASEHPLGLNYISLFQTSISDERLDQAIAGIKAVLSGQKTRFEHDYIRVDNGHICWYQMSVSKWRHEEAGAIIMHRDIGPHKLHHLNLENVEGEFHSLADSAPVMIWMSEPGEGCTFFNRKWLEFTGSRIEDQIGDGWLQFVHPEDRDRVLATYREAFEEIKDFACEYRLRHRDGGYRYIQDHGSPRFDSQNILNGYIGSAWDLSDQKKATAEVDRVTRFAHLVRDVAEKVNNATTLREALQHTIDTICQRMNFPVGHALLIDDDEPDLAKSSHVVYVKDMERFRALIEVSSQLTWPAAKGAPGEVMQTGKPVVYDIFETAKRPDLYPRSRISLQVGLRTGLHFPVLVDGKTEAIIEFASDEKIDSDGELIDCMVAASERLSRFFERRRAQIKFLKQKEELQASTEQLLTATGRIVDSQDEERRRIARDIHDDFTQRLAMVSMKIGRLAGRKRSSVTTEIDLDIEEIRNETASVANDLRLLSHQLHPAMLELLGFVAAMRVQCAEFQRFRGITVTFHASASDQDASPQASLCLYRALQECLMNISKHSGSLTAEVSLAKNAGFLELCIRDHGRGISNDAESQKGVGLKTIEERVKLLNGKLAINSKPGSGVEIVVTLPSLKQV